jgi:hypothetical protein
MSSSKEYKISGWAIYELSMVVSNGIRMTMGVNK